jgi:ABC-type Zn uptake system ZnuABC Zn-binding protein ZnuA
VASIFPLGDVARRVGGDVVRVEILLPAGQSPHGFEPKPAQAEALARADILLTVGFEVDVWAERLAEAARNPRLHRVTLARSVGRQDSSGSDPHAWLDPVVMSAFTADVASAMIELRPDAGAAIAARAAAYRAELDSLDAAYRVRLAAVPGKAFVTLHAAFHYLAARYGLQQVAIFDSDMHEPGPRALEGVVRFIRREAVPVLFVQPQLPLSAVALLREETGVRVMTLDDLGNPLQPGYDSYLAMMRSNLDALAAGLGEPR